MSVKDTGSVSFKGCCINQDTVQHAPRYKIGFPALPAQLLLTAPMQGRGSLGARNSPLHSQRGDRSPPQSCPPVLVSLATCYLLTGCK